MGVLNVKQVVFLEIVEVLDQLRRLLEIHLLIVDDLFDLFVFATLHQPLEIFLELIN